MIQETSAYCAVPGEGVAQDTRPTIYIKQEILLKAEIVKSI